MRRLWMIGIGLMLASRLWAGNIPAEITYQGTLRTGNVPTNDRKAPMRFRITDVTGKVFWTSGDLTVEVTNGIFSARLSPTGVDWQNVTPYLEVEVYGQTLSPREPIVAGVYAMMSQSIVDGAVTRAKVDAASFETPGAGLVPPGAIMIFETNCPAGWKVYTALQGKFLVGADGGPNFSVGESSGSLNHVHTISADGAHTHTTPSTCNANKCNVDFGGNGAEYIPAASGWVPQTPSMTTSSAGNHNHGGLTGTGNNLPPYLSMVFCQKQ